MLENVFVKQQNFFFLNEPELEDKVELGAIVLDFRVLTSFNQQLTCQSLANSPKN